MDKSQITQALQGDPRWRVLPNQTRQQLDDKKHTWYVLNFQQKSLFPAGEADGPIV